MPVIITRKRMYGKRGGLHWAYSVPWPCRLAPGSTETWYVTLDGALKDAEAAIQAGKATGPIVKDWQT